MTVESGMVLRDLIEVAAEAGLALPHSPYWSGLTIGGLLATGAHGSSLKGKGGAVHEYVVGMRIVTPAPRSQGFAVVRQLCADHPDLDAAKVSLGVLGVVSQAVVWGGLHEFGDMAWLPQQRNVIYRKDNRVAITSVGNDLNDYLALRSSSTADLISGRVMHELLEKKNNTVARCKEAPTSASLFEKPAYGFTNNDSLFMGYPVVGFQHRIQASGSCLENPEDALLTTCPWDPRIRGIFFYNNAYSIALSRVPAFIADMKQLRNSNPKAFYGIDASLGILLRYIKASSAYLGKPEDSVDFDITYYRSYTKGEPEAGKFLEVKGRYDPDGIFSSEWSDQVLGINGSPIIVEKGCAIEGLCVCSEDSHCAPEQGYYCRPGKVYREARVCSFQPN
ncbi:unnamed protein product [Triticum turgidum subsp. durum]|uniref:FAD-binding PCMH-type domain-containing protein n=1 Tax=Triticum turgidum subsp. durum TaxID=4567 RepID=A0A9R0TC34_TRITD|nr:unnamed protein product [Triticum turgidum subsp. durum]